jgi:hypothetical protein
VTTSPFFGHAVAALPPLVVVFLSFIDITWRVSYNTVMRRSIALSVILALLLALCRAPFFHLHEGKDHSADEPGHHHLALISHTHLGSFPASSHHCGETSVGAWQASRNAQPIDLLVLERESSLSLPVQIEQVAFHVPLILTGLTIYEPAPRTHDPPVVDSSIPRSPPA